MEKSESQKTIGLIENHIIEQLSNGPKTIRKLIYSYLSRTDIPTSSYHLGFIAMAEENLCTTGRIRKVYSSGKNWDVLDQKTE
jgi:hypothetical protein